MPTKDQTAWFTFGFDHAHAIAGFTFDKDIVVKITAADPRARMFELFGQKWSMQYGTEPDLSFYPRGVKEMS